MEVVTMRVNELRSILSKYEAAELREIIVATYKTIPTDKKKDHNLDEYLQDFTIEKSISIKKESTIDFPSLKSEIETFLENANDGYYMRPNQYVRKEKRFKWRFEVRGFIKQLLLVKGENSEEAARFLIEIYNMLSYACSYYVFPSQDALPATGYEQVALLKLVLEKLFQNGYSKENIKTATYLVLDSNVDQNTIHRKLFFVLLDTLKTPDTKELALEYCKKYPKDYYSYQSAKEWFKVRVDRISSLNDDYRYKEHSNHAAELYTRIKFSLRCHDEGIAYYWKHTNRMESEIVLYMLLRYLLHEEELNHLWIREYDKAVASGIKPRKDLRMEYAGRKKDSFLKA